MHAIKKTIEALRGIERWGSGEDMEAAFSGFAALPASPTGRPWHVVLECRSDDSMETITQQYRRLTMSRHPDRGGSTAVMQELNTAYDHAKKAKGE
jgi:DnaJ-domain-containing protein 1